MGGLRNGCLSDGYILNKDSRLSCIGREGLKFQCLFGQGVTLRDSSLVTLVKDQTGDLHVVKYDGTGGSVQIVETIG